MYCIDTIHLIPFTADGCIFVWRIPHKDFESKLAEPSEPPLSTATVEEAEDIKESADEIEALARCSMETKGTETTGEDNSIPLPEQSIAAFIDMSALPAWGLPNGPGSPSSNVQGKWAQVGRLHSKVPQNWFFVVNPCYSGLRKRD